MATCNQHSKGHRATNAGSVTRGQRPLLVQVALRPESRCASRIIPHRVCAGRATEPHSHAPTAQFTMSTWLSRWSSKPQPWQTSAQHSSAGKPQLHRNTVLGRSPGCTAATAHATATMPVLTSARFGADQRHTTDWDVAKAAAHHRQWHCTLRLLLPCGLHSMSPWRHCLLPLPVDLPQSKLGGAARPAALQ
jgi:hypothetical protein